MRHIVHIDLDSFFVSVERMKDSSLLGKPVIIGGSEERGVVASCSYETRKFGVHSAMPIKTAKSLCPHAIIIKGDYMSYSRASHHVTQIIHNTVPLYEKTSIDEFYIDLSGMDKFHGCYKIASELRQKIIKKTGLPISFGLSANKTVSKIATNQAKPNGQLYIEHGREKAFLAPLDVSEIPMIGAKACKNLYSMGIYKIHQLQREPLANLERVFGNMGLMMHNKANGIDNSQVEYHHERKSISSEHTFDADSIDLVGVENLLISMTEQLTFRLRKEFKAASCIAVKIRYSNFETFTQQVKIPATTNDNQLFPVIKDLFNKLYQKGKPIRLIGVRLSQLSDGNYQPDLFEGFERSNKLYNALDKLNSCYGSKTISRAATMNIKEREFNPFNGKTADN